MSARCRWLLLLVALPACGARSPEGESPAAAPLEVAMADAAPIAVLDLPDAAPPADAGPMAFFGDAGLGAIGVAPCEALVVRLLTCPGMPDDSKRQMAATSRRWRQEAATSTEARQRLAATCLEMSQMSEGMLLQIGC